jgi:hypothetical protein
VDANDSQLTRVLLLQFPQLRKYVHAVNSTVRPEVENEYLAIEVGKLQRTLRVEPV